MNSLKTLFGIYYRTLKKNPQNFKLCVCETDFVEMQNGLGRFNGIKTKWQCVIFPDGAVLPWLRW